MDVMGVYPAVFKVMSFSVMFVGRLLFLKPIRH